MIRRCQKHPDVATWPTHMHSLVFAPARPYVASSVTRIQGSLPWHGAQKNVLRDLRRAASQLLRPDAAKGTRSVERPVPCAARFGSSPRSVPAVQSGEAGTPFAAGRQSVLYPALRLLRGPALPLGDEKGGGRGAVPGLARSQGAGHAVHARTTEARGYTRAAGGIDEISIRKGSHLPHCRQRPFAAPADLVRRFRIAPRRAWTSFIGLSGKRRRKRSAWR
jgi:hypothetical protein